MISASFFTRGGETGGETGGGIGSVGGIGSENGVGTGGALCGFCIRGHSGRGSAGTDIVCAAVSALTMYAANLLTEDFSVDCELKTDEKEAKVALTLKEQSKAGEKIIAAFRRELASLAKEYPQNISIKEIQNA